ncbi:MAG: RNHCP domain-containing protein [Armatimonadota bacterium]
MNRRTNFIGRTNCGFTCEHCGAQVLPLLRGGFRNHCPKCLWSKHVDCIPGDREDACAGLMEPVGVDADAKRTWMVVHRCVRCRAIRRNRAALTDPRQPDDFDAMLAVVARVSTR